MQECSALSFSEGNEATKLVFQYWRQICGTGVNGLNEFVPPERVQIKQGECEESSLNLNCDVHALNISRRVKSSVDTHIHRNTHMQGRWLNHSIPIHTQQQRVKVGSSWARQEDICMYKVG